MPRHNEQFRFYRQALRGSQTRLSDVWPFEPFDGRRRWTVRAVERVLRGANSFNVDVYQGTTASKPVTPGSVALAVGAGTQIQVNGFAYALVHDVRWEAPTTAEGGPAVLWDPENASGIGGLEKLISPAGRTFGIAAYGVGGYQHGFDYVSAEIAAGKGYELTSQTIAPIAQLPDDFYTNPAYLHGGVQQVRVGGVDLRYFLRTRNNWAFRNARDLFPTWDPSGPYPNLEVFSPFSSLTPGPSNNLLFPDFAFPESIGGKPPPFLFSTEANETERTSPALEDRVTGRRFMFRYRVGNLTQIWPLPDWIDPETYQVTRDVNVFAFDDGSRVDYIEGDRAPFLGTTWHQVGDTPYSERLGYSADETGRFLGMDSFSAKFGPVGFYGHKFVSAAEYSELHNDWVRAIVQHFERNSPLLETRRIWANPVALGGATVQSGLNNGYEFDRSSIRYLPTLVRGSQISSSRSQFPWTLPSGETFSESVPAVRGRIAIEGFSGNGSAVVLRDILTYSLRFSVLSEQDLIPNRPDIDALLDQDLQYVTEAAIQAALDEDPTFPQFLEGTGDAVLGGQLPTGGVLWLPDPLVPPFLRATNPDEYILTASPETTGGDVTTTRLLTVRPALISDVGLRDIVSLLDRRVSEIAIGSLVTRAWVRVLSQTAGVETVAGHNTANRNIISREVLESMSFEMRQNRSILVGTAVLDSINKQWDIVGVDFDDDRLNMIVRVERTSDHEVQDSPYGNSPVPIRRIQNRT